jgi:hypothetical protein
MNDNENLISFVCDVQRLAAMKVYRSLLETLDRTLFPTAR